MTDIFLRLWVSHIPTLVLVYHRTETFKAYKSKTWEMR